MHRVQQVGGCIRRPAPVVRHRTQREMVVDMARVHGTMDANEFEQPSCVSSAGDGPWGMPAARMHQAEDAIGDEAVVDEEVFVDAEPRILALEVTRTVLRDPMT